MQLSIRQCEFGDIQHLNQFVKSAQHLIENQYFETAFQEQMDKKRIVLLAFAEGVLAGYVHLNFNPLYAPFAHMNIPEIQDLFVNPNYRRQGIGEHLILACEKVVNELGLEAIGIGVGVTGDFGSAQRLYIRMGYVPDGAGVVFERQKIQSGDIRPIDDRLCLMVVKTLT
jgi:ribosomal protein S18 acetylase RimI-like enzyme